MDSETTRKLFFGFPSHFKNFNTIDNGINPFFLLWLVNSSSPSHCRKHTRKQVFIILFCVLLIWNSNNEEDKALISECTHSSPSERNKPCIPTHTYVGRENIQTLTTICAWSYKINIIVRLGVRWLDRL